MTSPRDVAAFHAEYDVHTDDRIRLFRVIADLAGPSARVLYPGSYVDIAPSVWFDDVTYVDIDKRAPRFFAEDDAVSELVGAKRRLLDLPERSAAITFHYADYATPLPEPSDSFDLLVSLYAGFISEHCTQYLRIGGTLLVNPSHGDAAMASIDPRYELTGVITSKNGDYRVSTSGLDTYGRGIGYTRSPFAYLFTRRS